MGNLSLAFFIVIATYLNVFICNTNFINKELFQKVNILQIVTPILNISLTIFIAYLINIKLAKHNKSNEILISLLEKYEDDIDEIHIITMKYIRDKKQNDAKDIKWLLKKMNIKIAKLGTLYEQYNISFSYPIDKMKKDILELKKSITDDPFMQENEYTAKQKTTIIQIFEEIKTSINTEKINLYK